ncbi:MAG TPA: chromate resistance protein ChrB domain-containing protein, partial [bacterium]
MKWVTRKNANVDRVACPWLIRRFIDPDAEFLYVGADIPAEIAIEPEAAGLRAIAHGFATIHG